MEARRSQALRLVSLLVIAVVLIIADTAAGQSTGRVPSGAPAPFLPASTDPTPSNPLGLPGPYQASNQMQAVLISKSLFQGIIPNIGNLEFGYLWSIADTYRQGVFTLDYTAPINLTSKDLIFGETHWRFDNFLRTLSGSPSTNLQLLLGGGYRRRLAFNRMVGINGFYNAVRLQEQWLSSEILGLEMAEVRGDGSVISLKLNYYGNVFRGRGGALGAWKDGLGDYKLEAAYSVQLAPFPGNVRARFVGYKLDRHKSMLGWNLGVDLSTSNRAFIVRYEYGYDEISLRYHNIHAVVHLAFQVDRLFSGENPISLPR